MKTNLALANILNNVPKTALSLAGICVAIVLIFMQLGFRGAVGDTAVNIYQKLDFDILVRSPNYLHFTDASRIDRHALEEIAGATEIASVNFLNVSGTSWRNAGGEYKGALLLGLDPANTPLLDDAINQQLDQLTSLDSLLVDTKSHREFSPANGKKFSQQDVGRTVQVAGQPMTINGLFSMGAGLAANGAAIVTRSTFDQLLPMFGQRNTTFGLIKLQPDANAEAVVAALKRRFAVNHPSGSAPAPSAIEILTRAKVMQRELDRWMNETPIGFIFTLGVLIAFLVGASIVYMVLGNDVADRLHEYATLLAMGYSNPVLASVVMKQAIYLAVFAFVPALLISMFLYWLTSTLANLELAMNWTRVLFVMILTLLMCLGSGTLALRKLWKAAPADLF